MGKNNNGVWTVIWLYKSVVENFEKGIDIGVHILYI